jgi:hypothetical protein
MTITENQPSAARVPKEHVWRAFWRVLGLEAGKTGLKNFS